MTQRNLMAFATAFVCLATLPHGLNAQGKGKGGDKNKGDRVEDRVSRENGGDQVRGDRSDDRKAEKSSRGKSISEAINSGVRGAERRSDRANEVAAGPKPGGKRSQFLTAREVKGYDRELSHKQVNARLRSVFASNRNSDLIAGGALAYGLARGISPSDLSSSAIATSPR